MARQLKGLIHLHLADFWRAVRKLRLGLIPYSGAHQVAVLDQVGAYQCFRLVEEWENSRLPLLPQLAPLLLRRG